jgi:phosphoglycolate phosphatase-like HAD superfamily hydrolase
MTSGDAAGADGRRPLAVFDIDGVVADVRHRLHHIEGGQRDWRAFHRAAVHDPPLAEGLALVAELGREHRVVWLSGRPEWARRLTRDWLAGHELPSAEIHLRGERDWRPAPVFKLDVLRRLRAAEPVAAFIDDDSAVIDAAVQAGLPAVLADWVSRSDSLREAQDRLGRA